MRVSCRYCEVTVCVCVCGRAAHLPLACICVRACVTATDSLDTSTLSCLASHVWPVAMYCLHVRTIQYSTIQYSTVEYHTVHIRYK